MLGSLHGGESGDAMTLELIEAARLLKIDPAHGWLETFDRTRVAALQSWRKLMELALASGATHNHD